jgi:alkylglycerol monooxygenase
VFSKFVLLGIYVWCYEHLRLATLPLDAWWVWLSGLIAYDFFYYWQHRLSHEVGVLWASHVVHHQSEDFNLSTALRQTSTSFLLAWLFYLPMALAGYPPLVFVVVALIDLLYQFWIHTEQIRKLGWFDRVFASPSNHRVHHGVNDRYLDKNYGGIFILWDRWFGTFIDEDDAEPVIYGTRSPLRSFDPLWANLEVYVALARDAWHARRWRDKLLVWLKPPGWRPADVAARFPKPAFQIEAFTKFAPEVATGQRIYAGAHGLLAILAGTHVLALAEQSLDALVLAYALWVCLSLWSVCALLQGRRGAWVVEGMRLLLSAAALGVAIQWSAMPIPMWSSAIIAATVLASGLAAMALRRGTGSSVPAPRLAS